MGQSLEGNRHRPQRVFSQWYHIEHTSPLAVICDHKCEMLSTREAHLILGVRIFLRDQSHKHCWPNTCKNSRLPKGEQVFSKKPGLYKWFRYLELLSSVLREVGTFLKSKSPDSDQWQSYMQAFQNRAVGSPVSTLLHGVTNAFLEFEF